jgi:acyl carrier protein
MDEVEYKVIEIISKSLKLDKSKITLQSRIVEDLGADSVDQVEIVMDLDEAFGVDIPDEEAAKIASVADAVDFIKKNIQQ